MINRAQVLETDITKLDVDVVVNAAKHSLLGGGGVDGAIHAAAGPALLENCRTLNGCDTGKAKITLGFALPAQYIVHTVGPVWRGGLHKEPQQLAACYNSPLSLAVEHRLRTIAFPAISCGAYGYPIEEACQIAMKEVGHFLTQDTTFEKVIFSCSNNSVKTALLETLSKSL